MMETSKKRLLLLVDDEPDITFALKQTLQENGFEVDSFNDPLLVLQSFKAHFYDFLILDIRMPEMDGFELYREIKKKDSSVKVCFLTALTELQDYEQYKNEVCPKLGERYFVVKPIDNEELIRRVNEMIESSNISD